MLENPEHSETEQNGMEAEVIDAQFGRGRWTRGQKLEQFLLVYGLGSCVL